MKRLAGLFVVVSSCATWGCGAECSDNQTLHEERVENVAMACSPSPAGECAASYCAAACPELTGTDNASFTLDDCSMQQPTTLVCHYTRTSEWCD